jgi:hypothetical protein
MHKPHETTNKIIEDNVELLLQKKWSADEATATVERHLGDDQYQLYCTYEGQLTETNERFVFDDGDGYQAAQLFDKKGPNTIEVIYMFIK